MVGDGMPSRRFSPHFDENFAAGHDAGNRAFFGNNVLRGLTEGINDFVELRQSRWKRYRSIGPALLGSATWFDDEELIGRLSELVAACIVVKKQRHPPTTANDRQKIERLIAANQRTPGIPLRAFSELTGLAPKVDGRPVLVGPYTPADDWRIPTIRTVGFRRRDGGDEKQAPIIHAKLALLGQLWWHDEDGSGAVADVIGFEARRLWVSSANFTESSRRNLEFGFWTEEPSLVAGAERFLVRLMRSSEGLDPEPDFVDPDLVAVDFDDDAMIDAMADLDWIDDDAE